MRTFLRRSGNTGPSWGETAQAIPEFDLSGQEIKLLIALVCVQVFVIGLLLMW